MWPFSRRARPRTNEAPPERAGAAEGRGEVFRPPGPGWSSLAAMPTALPTVHLTVNRSFDRELAAYRETRLTAGPLGHVVSADAPSGVVSGLAVAGRRPADHRAVAVEGPDLVYVSPPAAASAAEGADAGPVAPAIPSQRVVARSHPAGSPRTVRPAPAAPRLATAAGAPLRARSGPGPTPVRTSAPATPRPSTPAPKPSRERSPRLQRSQPPPPAAPVATPAGSSGVVRRRRLGAPLPAKPPMTQRLPADSGALPPSWESGSTGDAVHADVGTTTDVPRELPLPRPGGIRRPVQRQPDAPATPAAPSVARSRGAPASPDSPLSPAVPPPAASAAEAPSTGSPDRPPTSSSRPPVQRVGGGVPEVAAPAIGAARPAPEVGATSPNVPSGSRSPTGFPPRADVAPTGDTVDRAGAEGGAPLVGERIVPSQGTSVSRLPEAGSPAAEALPLHLAPPPAASGADQPVVAQRSPSPLLGARASHPPRPPEGAAANVPTHSASLASTSTGPRAGEPPVSGSAPAPSLPGERAGDVPAQRSSKTGPSATAAPVGELPVRRSTSVPATPGPGGQDDRPPVQRSASVPMPSSPATRGREPSGPAPLAPAPPPGSPAPVPILDRTAPLIAGGGPVDARHSGVAAPDPSPAPTTRDSAPAPVGPGLPISVVPPGPGAAPSLQRDAGPAPVHPALAASDARPAVPGGDGEPERVPSSPGQPALVLARVAGGDAVAPGRHAPFRTARPASADWSLRPLVGGRAASGPGAPFDVARAAPPLAGSGATPSTPASRAIAARAADGSIGAASAVAAQRVTQPGPPIGVGLVVPPSPGPTTSAGLSSPPGWPDLAAGVAPGTQRAAMVPTPVGSVLGLPRVPALHLARPTPSGPASGADLHSTPAPTRSSGRPGSEGAAQRGSAPVQRAASQPSPPARPGTAPAAPAARPSVPRPPARPVSSTVQRTVTAARKGPEDAGGTASQVDLDVLVDKVLRRVRDQLRVDRERRGTIADRKA